MTTEKLDEAIELIKSGNKQAALPLLKESLRANPKDENAWLWLHVCVEKVDEKKYCLQRALEINPNNQQARARLEKLNAGPAPEPVQPSVVTSQTSAPPAQEQMATPARSPLWWVFIAVVVLVLLCAGLPLFYFLQTGMMSSFAANLRPLASPTVTPVPSATLTPKPSATFTTTPTRRPSATFIPEAASPTTPPTSLPTSTPFTPGNPTAIQPGSDIQDPNFQKGVDAYLVEDFQTAISLFSAVIAADPSLAPPYRYRGAAYSKAGNCQLGFADSNKALAIDPNYAGAWESHGFANSCMYNESAVILDLQKALSIDGSLATSHHSLGVAYDRLKDYPKALEEYNIAIAIDPKRSKSWAGKGAVLIAMGEFEECINSANEALTLKPVALAAYIERAQCYTFQGKTDEAIQDYTSFISLTKQRAPEDLYNLLLAHNERAALYFWKREYNQAIADYKSSVAINSGDPHILCQLSYSYFEVKQYKNAIEAGKASRAINPACGGQKLLGVMARSSYGLGDYKQALEYIDQAVGVGAPSVNHYYRALILKALDRDSEAITELESFLATNPAGPDGEAAQKLLDQLQP